ncbi:MAG: hypothetical protein NXI13_11515 [Proteobacteria bacterium]|nr:hypothetical protein [Pseudomonadota bacterium]
MVGAQSVKSPPLMSRCKRRLAMIWLLIGGAIFLVLLGQSFFGKYGDLTQDAWGWFLPSVMPTLSLIVTVMVFDALNGSADDKPADRFMYLIAVGLSVFYLLIVFSTILVQPLTAIGPIELMNQSNLWLGPLQGLVAASLGAFFVKQGEEEE